MHLLAQSISRSAPIGRVRQVLAVFDHACDLVSPDGEVAALVSPAVGDGPLNIVVAGLDRARALIRPGMAIRREGTRLHVGPLTVELNGATPWNPRPDWATLRRARPRIVAHLPMLRTLIPDLDKRMGLPTDQATHLLHYGPQAEDLLRLAGRGQGLTPAGDDFLMGWMLRTWLDRSDAAKVCSRLAEAAAPHTTTLSAAMLRAAARGECNTGWHTLLFTLAEGRAEDLAPAVERVLTHGHTSGADTLAGFLAPRPGREGV